MTQIEVGFSTIFGNITLTMLIGVECSRIDIDVWIEFLDGYCKPTCQKKLGQ